MNTYRINLESICQLNDEEFYQLCRDNPEVKFERNFQGELIIMSPTGGETGSINADFIGQFWSWNQQAKLGKIFDSSTCFKLPSGADRSPDLAWISKEKWEQLNPEEREKFPPLAPDFILELMSPSDSLKETQLKLQEYMENGVRLGWLIDRRHSKVEIYRQNKKTEILDRPLNLSGENVLPGFVLNLQNVWK